MQLFRSSLEPEGLETLRSYVMHQCRTFFPLPDLVQEDLSTTHVGVALEASLACFKRVRNPYYQNDDGAFLDVRHAAMYCSFLYRLSFACRGSVWAEPLYNLNRTLHGCDLFWVASGEVVYVIKLFGVAA